MSYCSVTQRDAMTREFHKRLLDGGLVRPNGFDGEKFYKADDPSGWSLEKLADAGADALGRDEDGTPFMHLALAQLNPDLADCLFILQCHSPYRWPVDDGNDFGTGADRLVQGTDGQGRTAVVMVLHELAHLDDRGGSLPEADVRHLVWQALRTAKPNFGRDLSHPDQVTPLHLAAELPEAMAVPAIETLLDFGAPLHARDDRYGETVAEWLVRTQSTGDDPSDYGRLPRADDEGVRRILGTLATYQAGDHEKAKPEAPL